MAHIPFLIIIFCTKMMEIAIYRHQHTVHTGTLVHSISRNIHPDQCIRRAQLVSSVVSLGVVHYNVRISLPPTVRRYKAIVARSEQDPSPHPFSSLLCAV